MEGMTPPEFVFLDLFFGDYARQKVSQGWVS